ncbi:DUF6083 domain-containing protein [Actinacidiphila glaucinigra]|uniref:DUF6083 domain-containing protein n=1 Tax=Actinacidiphila glaucinigra TaxID=235986 RepID=UPI00366A98D9
MHNTPHPPHRRWDGSHTSARPRRSLRVTSDPGTRLMRCGQPGQCRDCDHRIEWYYRADHRPVPLHPHELPASALPEAARWHVSAGIAYPADDGSPWCRLPHAALCPASTTESPQPQLAGLRRRMAARTRRLIDTGTFTPRPAQTDKTNRCRPARPIVQILGIRYLAARPVDDIRCLARATRTRARCDQPLAAPDAPPGTWRLLPATATTGQLALPANLAMAVYDLTALPYVEQLRWRAQRCPHHAHATAEMATTDWEPFDPLTHHEHIHPRLPDQIRPTSPGRPCTAP